MRLALIVLLSYIFFSSCVYTPRTIQVPLIEEQGDLVIDGGVSTSSPIYGSISYGFSKMLAVQAHASFDYYQGAIGYFNKYNEKPELSNVFESYQGVAYGIVRRDEVGYLGNESISGNYQVYFNQLNFGWVKENFEGGFALKLGLMNYDFEEKKEIYGYDQPDEYSYSHFSELVPMVEPCMFMRMGLNNWKLMTQFGLFYAFDPNNKVNGRFAVTNFSFGVGVIYNFNVFGDGE